MEAVPTGIVKHTLARVLKHRHIISNIELVVNSLTAYIYILLWLICYVSSKSFPLSWQIRVDKGWPQQLFHLEALYRSAEQELSNIIVTIHILWWIWYLFGIKNAER